MVRADAILTKRAYSWRLDIFSPAPIFLFTLLLISACTKVDAEYPLTASKDFRPSPLMERKFASTVRQKLDFSCGAAAVATILRFYFNEKVGEITVLRHLQKLPDVGDWKTKMSEGFSFDDLMSATALLGYESQSAEIGFEELAKLNGPVIVHLDKETFQHFVVLRRIGDSVVYVSDPIVGDTIMPESRFKKQYTGNAMAIWKPDVDLPEGSRLEAVRDGLSVRGSIRSTVRPYTPRSHPLL